MTGLGRLNVPMFAIKQNLFSVFRAVVTGCAVYFGFYVGVFMGLLIKHLLFVM